MWTDYLPKLQEKFRELRILGWGAHIDSQDQKLPDSILNQYEDLSQEMVEAIQVLFVPMIENQVFLRKVYPHMDQELYVGLHVAMMDKISDAIDPEVQSMPEFYFRMYTIMEHLNGYCTFLRQDIRSAFRRNDRFRHDRRFRQVNLQVVRVLEGIGRLMKRCQNLSTLIAGSQTRSALDMILKSEQDRQEIMEMLASGNFSEEEVDMLLSMLD